MIRECEPNDINKILDCVNLAQSVADVPQMNEVNTQFLIQNLKKGIVSPDHKILVKETQNKIIAFIVGSISQNIHNDKVYGEVTDLFVHPEMMKWTVSAELFKELENWFVEENCEYLVALPSSWNSDYTINNNLLEEMKNFYDKQCNLVGYVFVKGL